MSTTHRIVYDDSSELSGIEDESVDLVVTSPPYPMVAMWDETVSYTHLTLPTNREV